MQVPRPCDGRHVSIKGVRKGTSQLENAKMVQDETGKANGPDQDRGVHWGPLKGFKQ